MVYLPSFASTGLTYCVPSIVTRRYAEETRSDAARSKPNLTTAKIAEAGEATFYLQEA
jgi:hypothetical protein